MTAAGNVVPLKIGLTDAQKEARKNRWGGSDATIIAKGVPEDVDRLIKEKRGDIPAEDLSDNIPVFMGNFTEPANFFWLQKRAGLVTTNIGESVLHPKIRFGSRGGMGCTLDGLTILENGERAVVQAKLVDQYARLDEVVDKHFPQIQHEMHVCDVRWGVFSVLFAHIRFGWVIIPKDDAYVVGLIDMEREAWECVESGRPWRDMYPPEMPELPEKARPPVIRDMSGNNEFMDAAHDYLRHKPHMEAFKRAEARLKGDKKKGIPPLIPEGVTKAFGGGIQLTKSAGKLSIREHKKSANTPPPSAPITDEIPHFDNFFEKMEF